MQEKGSHKGERSALHGRNHVQAVPPVLTAQSRGDENRMNSWLSRV